MVRVSPRLVLLAIGAMAFATPLPALPGRRTAAPLGAVAAVSGAPLPSRVAVAGGGGAASRSTWRVAKAVGGTASAASSPSSSSSSSSSSAPASGSKSKKAEEAKLAPPPSTFFQAVTQAATAATAAFAAGDAVVEVEFPPLPTDMLESSAVSAYDVSDANFKLAIDFARIFTVEQGRRTVIVFPDAVEKDRAVEQNGESEEPLPGVRLGVLKDTVRGSFFDRIWTSPDVDVAVRPDDDMFVIVGASAQELPDVERLVAAAAGRPVVLFNLKLDAARGDLGLPAFPRKRMHFEFLSTVRPVYYLRTRSYSRSVPRPPYLVNYSGALYRVYPGAYQVLLDTSEGNYRRVAVLPERPPLGQVRDTLTAALSLDGPDGEANSDAVADFLRKGYKSKTWWEEDRVKQLSNTWRE